MSLLLVGVGLLLLALPGVLGRSGARLAPREWGRVIVTCLRVGRLAIHAGLAFAALPAALATAGAHGLARACHPLAAGDLPLPLPAGGAAGLLLAVSAGWGVAIRCRNAAALRRLRAEPWLGRHRVVDGVDVVTLPCAERVAYAVPGRPAQVVVSDGLLAGLDPEEAEAVVRHERGHLRHRHHAALALAGDVEARLGWFPPARASAGALRLAVERGADEDAGAASASARPAVRTALLKTVGLVPTGPVPAFTDACTVAARVRALASTPPSPRLRDRVAAAGPVLAVGTLALATLVGCLVPARHGIHSLTGHDPAGHEHHDHDHGPAGHEHLHTGHDRVG